MGPERLPVRLGIPGLLVASCAGAAAVSWHANASEIPAFAFHSQVVLAVQVALLFFYAGLLLLVPLVRALVDGDLPIELSLRGARWREELPDLGGDLLTRLEVVEANALRTDADRRRELQVLKQELKEDALALEDIIDQAAKRMAAIEEKDRRCGCRG